MRDRPWFVAGLPVACAAAALVPLGGCGHSQRAEFDDRPRGEVWQAVVQACRAPRYPDWVVIANEVSVDDASSRVSVYLDLRRDVVEPGLVMRPLGTKWTLRVTAVLKPIQ